MLWIWKTEIIIQKKDQDRIFLVITQCPGLWSREEKQLHKIMSAVATSWISDMISATSMCHGLTPASSWAPQNHSLLSSCPHPCSGMEEWIGKVKKLRCWDKDSLKSKSKAMHSNKANQGIDSPLPIVRQVFSHPHEGRASSCPVVTWEDTHHYSKCPPLLGSSPSFIHYTWSYKAWNISLVSWDQLSWLCPLPVSHAPPAYLMVGWCRE